MDRVYGPDMGTIGYEEEGQDNVEQVQLFQSWEGEDPQEGITDRFAPTTKLRPHCTQ